jgi:hypothetical protein
MSLPVSFHAITYADNTRKQNGDPETTTVSFPITTLTAANYVAQSALLATLDNAVAAVVIGELNKKDTTILRQQISVIPSADPLAQRENKLLIRYHGVNLNKKFRASIGTFDLTLLTGNSEFLDLTAGAGLDLKNAIEAVVKSPDDASEAVVVDSAQFVGRNT